MVDYENPWIFEGSPFLSEDIDGVYGFVYRITNIQSQANNTSDANTSGRSANLKEVSAGSLLKVIGSGITDRVQNSKRTSNSMEKNVSSREILSLTWDTWKGQL